MKYSILAVASALFAGSDAAAAVIKETFTEHFSHNDTSCDPSTNLCQFGAGDPLPGPTNALLWENLATFYQIGRFPSGGTVSLYPYDVYWAANFKNNSIPATLSSKYDGTCVKNWELSSFAYGCEALQPYGFEGNEQFNLTYPANCTVTVKGYCSGKLVGSEKFSYLPYPLQSNFAGAPIHGLTLFNTTKNGLKGKKVERVTIQGKLNKPDPGKAYLSGPNQVLDAVTYTVYNATKCS